jgi:hypothetical protein
MKPTAADIAIVIGKIEAGDWLDPSEEPISWSCVLYDPEGERAGGSGGSRETSVTRNGGDPTIMAPPPHPKTPPISPIFTADSVTLVVSREKDRKSRLVYAGWDDVRVFQPDRCGQARSGVEGRMQGPPLCVTAPLRYA